MKLLKRAGLTLMALICLLAILPAFLPTQVRVQRTLQMKARPEHIYPDVAALSAWNDWSEWNEREDPAYRRHFEGPAMGVGNTLRFTSGSGPGVQRIVRADPAAGVDYDIALGEEASLHILGTIAFEPGEGSTLVRWTDTIDFSKSYPLRLLGPLMDGAQGEKMVKSLERLAQRAEARRAEADRVRTAQPANP